MRPKPASIAIIQGHPDPVRPHYCHALADAYVAGASEAGRVVQTIAVAQLIFPFLQSRDDLERGEPPAAIHQAQGVIANADHLVMLYPVWNGAMPALLKGFVEQVFRPAFMFPDFKAGDKLGFSSALKQRKALTGKTARIVATMQMPGFVFRLLFHPRPDLTPLRLAGITRIRQSLVGLVDAGDPSRRERWLHTMRALGRDGL